MPTPPSGDRRSGYVPPDSYSTETRSGYGTATDNCPVSVQEAVQTSKMADGDAELR